jgi:hypothetical protein
MIIKIIIGIVGGIIIAFGVLMSGTVIEFVAFVILIAAVAYLALKDAKKTA